MKMKRLSLWGMNPILLSQCHIHTNIHLHDEDLSHTKQSVHCSKPTDVRFFSTCCKRYNQASFFDSKSYGINTEKQGRMRFS